MAVRSKRRNSVYQHSLFA